MLWTDKVKKILKQYWNIDSLKDKQIEVINELLLGNDVIGLLPTGYGKSMCYLLPPLLTKKTMIIISPLISLMDDQVDKLIKKNIPVSALHSNNKHKDSDLFEIIDGHIKIVYMSPEYLIKGDGLELINSLVESKKMGFLAVDESHCISVWGHDFRPEYLKIKVIREMFPQIPLIAVTATATNQVVNEISKFLSMNNPTIVRANFDRPNLYLECVAVKTINTDLLLPYFEKYKNDKIIIYTNSRQETVDLADKISKIQPAEAYHAGMSKGVREKVQSKFAEGKIKIIVSTIAFGMGVDQVVRCVIVFGAPSSIEEYWQQIGRGGRDNLPAEAILFFQYKSLAISRTMIKKECKNPIVRRHKENNLSAIGKYYYLKTCRRKFVLEHFNQLPDFFCCNNCDNCCKQDLTDTTEFIWNGLYTPVKNNIKNNKKIENIKQNLIAMQLIKIDKNNKMTLLKDLSKWQKYIEYKKYKNFQDLPDKLLVKLPLQDLYNISDDKDVFDKCEDLLNSIVM